VRDRDASGSPHRRPLPAFARCASLLAGELRSVSAAVDVPAPGGMDAPLAEPVPEQEGGAVDVAWASALREATRGVVADRRPSGAVRVAPYEERAGAPSPPGGEPRLDRRG
jgi:hypothetical protein